MLRKVFWEDPYLTHLDTRIATVAGDEVTLAATIIYAFSGGQESDRGTIGGYRCWRRAKMAPTSSIPLPADHGLKAR